MDRTAKLLMGAIIMLLLVLIARQNPVPAFAGSAVESSSIMVVNHGDRFAVTHGAMLYVYGYDGGPSAKRLKLIDSTVLGR